MNKRLKKININGQEQWVNAENTFYIVSFVTAPYHIWENKLYATLKAAQKARPLRGPWKNYWTIRKIKLNIIGGGGS